MADLSELRHALVDEIENRDECTYELAVAKAAAEANIIERAGGEKNLGTNAEARERNLILGLDDDPAYQEKRRTLRDVTHKVNLIQTEIDCLLDARRAREWALRERAVAVTERAMDRADNIALETAIAERDR